MNQTWKTLTCIFLTLVCLLAGSAGAVSAQEAEETLSQNEGMKVYELSPEEEAAIVHDVPPCPVIIDGVKYEPEDIHKFDGHRLWFTADESNTLYAFTTEKGIDAFHAKQRELLSGSENKALLRTSYYGYFYANAGYSGTLLTVLAGYPDGYLSSLGGMNNAISSFHLDAGVYKASLFDGTGYGGDVFERVGGTSISALSAYGWDNKASSLIVYD